MVLEKDTHLGAIVNACPPHREAIMRGLMRVGNRLRLEEVIQAR